MDCGTSKNIVSSWDEVFMKRKEVNKGHRRKCKYSTRRGMTLRITIAAINVKHMDVTIGISWCPFFTTTVNSETKHITSSEGGPKRISKYTCCVYVCLYVCIYVYMCTHVCIFVCMYVWSHMYCRQKFISFSGQLTIKLTF
jgi:hypothetical protein